MHDFRGFSYNEVTISYDLSKAIAEINESEEVFIDTKAMSLEGVCYLIQLSTTRNPKQIHIVKILKQRPSDIICFLDVLVTKKLIIHNAYLDIFHLAKLYVISKQVDNYSFDEIWQAEKIFRPNDCIYEERLSLLYSFYPKQVVDTMLIAQHSLPGFNEFLDGADQYSNSSKTFEFKLFNFPLKGLEPLKHIFSSKKAWNSALKRQIDSCSQIDYLRVHSRITLSVLKPDNNKGNENLLNVKISIDKKGVSSLKNLARYFDYIEKESIPSFGFLDSFPESIKLKNLRKNGTPTVPSEKTYEKLYQYCKSGYVDFSFIEDAARNILLLQLIYFNLPHEDSYTEALSLDLSLVSYFANFNLYGLKIDKNLLAVNRQNLSQQANSKLIQLNKLEPKLENPNTVIQSLDWLKKIVSIEIGLPANSKQLCSIVPNAKKDTVKKLIKMYPKIEQIKYLGEFKELNDVVSVLPFNTDTLFPKYNIYGTITNRMTSVNPNAQGIPSYSLARNFYTAPTIPSYYLCIGDFDQLELRIMAHKYKIKALIKAFKEGKDPHTQMGVDIFLNEIKEILSDSGLTKEDMYNKINKAKSNKEGGLSSKVDNHLLEYRNIGKLLNFMISYGTTKYGLALSINCSEDKAMDYIEAYFKVNPELLSARNKMHSLVNRLSLKVEWADYGTYSQWELNKNRIPPIINPFGLQRSFNLERSILVILYHLNGRSYLNSGYLDNFNSDDVGQFRSSVRAGFKRVQESIKREAFNFEIQSMGSYYTKYLQLRICSNFIPPGKVYKTSELSVLPTLNVHDEMHFYIQGKENKAKLDDIKKNVLNELSKTLDGDLSLSFSLVNSWADKC